MVNRPLYSRDNIEEGLIIWFLFLDHLARECIQQTSIENLAAIKSRKDILMKNDENQKKLMKIFCQDQRLCKECQDCCYISFPLFYIDCILYKIDPGNLLVAQPMAFSKLLKRMLNLLTPNVIKDFIKFLVKSEEQEEKPLINRFEENHYPVCPLLTRTGCSLPWGRRPVLCTIFLCKQQKYQMSRRDYARYLRLAMSYMINLTTGLTKVWLELRCKEQLSY